MRTKDFPARRRAAVEHARTAAGFVLALTLLLSPARTEAFSLLGPFAAWMDVEKGYHQANEIGGPMNINEGYRWNIPVLTYGFDRSFVDCFGSNGVAAVEEAIAMLNAVPPASVMDLEQFPARSAWKMNYRAESTALMDLKSQTLAFLLEQLGLADPAQYTFCVRDFQIYPGGDNYFEVIKRNFDPVTAQPSSWVNNTLLSYTLLEFGTSPTPGQWFCDAQEVPVDSEADGVYEPVISLSRHRPYYLNPYGLFVTNLTRDDVAGLKYLLDANRARSESLPADVHLANSNGSALIVTAVRPGVDKLTFVRHPAGTLNGLFLPFTNRWTDIYYDYFLPAYQEVERVTTRPDILFTARDLGPWQALDRSGTSNWVNNAELNGNAGGNGPGVIQGAVTITYNSAGPFQLVFGRINTNAFLTEIDATPITAWGSFGTSTNAPIVYPAGQVPFQPTQIHLRMTASGAVCDLRWPISGRPYGQFALETSTNFTAWSVLTTLTNSGGTFDYQFEATPAETARFFRAAPR